MSDTRSPRGGGGATAVILLLVLLLLPLLYVLSVGPAVWLVNRTGTGQQLAETVYAPLIWLHEQGGPVGQGLDWYVELFE